MIQLKLTNIWCKNWREFWDTLALTSQSDFDALELHFDENGLYLSDASESIEALVTLFKNSSSFRTVFDGYDEIESEAIVSSVSIVPDAAQNFKRICAAVLASWRTAAQAEGKTMEDMSYNRANGFEDIESETENYKAIAENYFKGQTILAKAVSAMDQKDPTVNRVKIQALYMAHDKEKVTDKFLLSLLNEGDAKKVIAAMAVESEISDHNKLRRTAYDKLMKMPVDWVGNTKNVEKGNEYARAIEFHEKEERRLRKERDARNVPLNEDAPPSPIAMAVGAGIGIAVAVATLIKHYKKLKEKAVKSGQPVDRKKLILSAFSAAANEVQNAKAS
jgi:hypothetical protein